MDEAVLEQEIQRPIDRRRRGHARAILESIEQVVGLDRNRRFGNEFKHTQADGGEAQATLVANPRHVAHKGTGIMAMCVRIP